MEEGAEPRAVVVLRRDDGDVLLGPVYGRDRCDLGFVDDLLRVQLAARRFGWTIQLRDVRADLRELIEMAVSPPSSAVELAPQRVVNGGYSSVRRKA